MYGYGYGGYGMRRRTLLLAGAALLLAGETEGFAGDPLAPNPANAAIVKRVNKTPALDDYLTNATTSPKQLPGAAGTLAWTAHNLLVRSEEIDNASWTKDAGVTVTANAAAASDGAATAERITPAVGVSNKTFYQTVTIINGARYTFAIECKSDGGQWVALTFGAGATADGAFFDVINGVLGTVAASATATITSLGSGWYLCSISRVASGTTYAQIELHSADNQVVGWNSAAGAEKLFVARTRFNRGPVPTAYLATTSAARFGVPIEFSPTSIGTRLGKHSEAAATNLNLGSNDLTLAGKAAYNASVIVNSVASPTGVVDADTLTETTANGIHGIDSAAIAVTNAVVYTGSVFLKKNVGDYAVVILANVTGWPGGAVAPQVIVDLTNGVITDADNVSASGIQVFPGGWYRVWLTQTAAASTNVSLFVGLSSAATAAGIPSYTGTTGSIYVWGAQFEAGSVATSPIPTFATTVTRAADDVKLTPLAGNIPFEHLVGTLWVEGTLFEIPASTGQLLIGLDAGDANNQHIIAKRTGSGEAGAVTSSAGSNTADISTGGVFTANVQRRIAYAYQDNNFAFSADGAAAITDSSGAVPASGITTLRLGVGAGGVTPMRGRISRAAYVSRRLTNAELQTNTASDTFAALQAAETQGLFIDFTSATPITVKWLSGVFSDPAQFFAFAGGSPKQAPRAVDGLLAYSPHNLIIRSEEIENVAWTKTRFDVIANAVVAPDGTTSADTIQANATNVDGSYLETASSITSTIGAIYTFRARIKAGTSSWARIIILSGAKYVQTYVNVATGVLGGTVVGTWAVLARTASLGADGFTDVTLSVMVDEALLKCFVGVCDADASDAVTSGKNVHIWGAQLNRGPVPTRYIRTTTAALYGLADEHHPTTFAKLGWLVEPAATNSVQQSGNLAHAAWAKLNVTGTAGVGVAPDGQTTFDRITPATGNSAKAAYQAFTATAVPWTLSVYAKADGGTWLGLSVENGASVDGAFFNLSTGEIGTVTAGATATIQPFPGGIYRLSITRTLVSGLRYMQIEPHSADNENVTWNSASGAEKFLLWGAQAELGSIASSPIPTFASAITRAADVPFALLTAMPTLGSEWSLSVRGSEVSIGGNSYFCTVDDATANELVGLRDNANKGNLSVIDGGAAQVSADSVADLVANVVSGMAASIKLNDFAFSKDGAAVVLDTVGTLPTPTRLTLGSSVAGTARARRITQVRLVPREWSDAEVPQKSAA